VTEPRAPLSLSETVRARRSFRAFHPQPIAASVIREALEEAQLAPSNCNTQPWNVHVVSGAKRDELSRALHAASDAGGVSSDFFWDEMAFADCYGARRREHGKLYYENLGVPREDGEQRRRAAAVNFSFFHAPHVALFFMPVVGDSVRVAGDIGMYGQTFLLSLAARGLGGVPQTGLGLYADTIREALGVSSELKLLFGISFGYPDADAPGNARRVGRAHVAEAVTFHT
jgi:nitroreductase